MGTTQPPVQYLFESSDNAVEAHFLSCQNHLANVERSLTDLVDRWLQTQNAERLGRTMLHLRRTGTDPQSPARVLAAGRLFFSPRSELLGAYRPSLLVRLLSRIASSADLYVPLQGSAFTIADRELTTVSTPTHSARLQESCSPRSGYALIDRSIRVPRKPRSRPSPTRPGTIEAQPARIKVCRARLGCLPLWANKTLLRAGEFPRCAKIA